MPAKNKLIFFQETKQKNSAFPKWILKHIWELGSGTSFTIDFPRDFNILVRIGISQGKRKLATFKLCWSWTFFKMCFWEARLLGMELEKPLQSSRTDGNIKNIFCALGQLEENIAQQANTHRCWRIPGDHCGNQAWASDGLHSHSCHILENSDWACHCF